MPTSFRVSRCSPEMTYLSFLLFLYRSAQLDYPLTKIRHDLSREQLQMLVHFLGWIARWECPGVVTLNRNFCDVIFDHLYCRLRRDNVEDATRLKCGIIGYRRKQRLPRFGQPLVVDIDLIADVRSDFVPAFFW